MLNFTRLRTAAAVAFLALPMTAAVLSAQSLDDQAHTILKLYDAGEKDSAYALVEPLKRKARFSPAILYTRARLTADDRALPLFKEAIALAPTGPWAAEAAHQLVLRYAEKRDSLAANIWLGVLKSGYSSSPRLAEAEEAVSSVETWEIDAADVADRAAPQAKPARPAKAEKSVVRPEKEPAKPVAKPATAVVRSEKDGTKPAPKPAAKSEKSSGEKPAAKQPAVAKQGKDADGAEKPSTKGTSETLRGSGMKGFALQLGLFPDKKSADARTTALRKKNLRTQALPKMVDGKKKYALVVGPYQSMDEAKKKRTTVASACDCQAFVVKVE